ncbi:hypothetical protein OEA41_010554 [Lepraria neglecta]|uniref:Uncharacterized protein n=1 Tax=Lepraria neglecta TaxID=209136 RepID=A0AAE0DDY5_9LECA|nr:hypothetical protein OEA41_010554 [Lepraria neglecta]
MTSRNVLELAKTHQPGENEAVRFIERWIARLGDEPKKQTATETPGMEGPETVDSGTGVPGARSSRDKTSRD